MSPSLMLRVASGFSPSTVSIVLNEAPLSQNLSRKTKEHIRSTALSMGYRPDASARSLRSRRSQTIGVMIFDISDPFCTLILRGIERAFDPAHFLPIVMDAHNDRKQFERYLEMMLERRVEGLIVVANWLFAEIELLPEFGRDKIPTVVVGRDLSSSIRSVIVDNEAGGYAALQHIYELGHREIAFVRGPRQLLDSSLRWKGMCRFAHDAGFTIDRALVTQLSASSDPVSGFEGGLASTKRLLARDRVFTALLAFDDLTALGAIRALYEAGLSTPEDCSVIGFDDVPFAALASPGLTTMRQPMEQMGEAAAGWILECLPQDGSAPAKLPPRLVMAPELVRRHSTRALGSKNPLDTKRDRSSSSTY